MLGRSHFRDLSEDPFFAAHRDHMRRMDEMFSNPFGGFGFGAGPARITQGRDNDHPHRERRNDELAPFGMFDMFGSMRQMMQNMESNFERMRNDPNAHCYTQSSFMSYSNTEQGKAPKIYQAMTSTRTAPGGLYVVLSFCPSIALLPVLFHTTQLVNPLQLPDLTLQIKETRKALRDSERNIEKMAIGHHINDRAHVIEKNKDTRTGDLHENQEFINLDEEDARNFDHEWQEKTQAINSRHLDYGKRGERSRQPELRRGQDRRALPSSEKRRDYRDRE